jgi:hydroxysqualene synthase
LQPAFYVVYAFSRIADDIADEPYSLTPAERVDLLENFSALLTKEHTCHPVFVGLQVAIATYQLPLASFYRLISAFQQDCQFIPFATWHDADDYCSRSANPIGELILRLYGLWNKEREPFSNAVCTGLQYANFWQDFSRDIPAGRCYVPQSELDKAALTSAQLFTLHEYLGKHQKSSNFKGTLSVISDDYLVSDAHNTTNNVPKFRQCLENILQHAEEQLIYGTQLLARIPPIRLRMELALTISGGLTILKHTRSLHEHSLYKRPALSIQSSARILLQSIRYCSESFFSS